MSANVEGYRNESFESLEAAVLETQRGRWFLEEYAKRQRSAETLAILDILRKLENTIVNTSFTPEAKPVEKISTEQLKFFKKDEELFVEPTLVQPSLTVVSPAPNPAPVPVAEAKPVTESKGARLKIQRLAPAQQTEEQPASEPVAHVAAPEPVTNAVPQPAAAATEPKSRVIIIRRPASEVGEIPMMDEKSPEVAA
jgi:hypothetical protein